MVGFQFFLFEGIGGVMPIMGATRDRKAFPSILATSLILLTQREADAGSGARQRGGSEVPVVAGVPGGLEPVDALGEVSDQRVGVAVGSGVDVVVAPLE